MTKLFIAGHSDSGDRYLPSGTLPWAERTRAWLEETQETPCELESIRFAPIGPRAVEYLLGAVEQAAPDFLVLPFGAYVFTVGTVAESVRQRFGERAGRLFLQTEARLQERTREGRVRLAINSAARKTTRRLLGTRTMATVEESTAIYEEILHRLARLESCQVVAIADARFSVETQNREPLMHSRIDQMHARLLPIVEQHHFKLVDVEGALRLVPDRSVLYQADGVHTTAAFHDVYFGLMREALIPRPPPPGPGEGQC